MSSAINNLRKDQSASVAIEFALVSLLFLLTVIFILYIGLLSYYRMCLDYATYKASRQVMIGATFKSGVSQTQFITSYICPYLPYGMACSNVILNLYTVGEAPQPAGYYTYVNSSATALNIPSLSNASASFSVGMQKQYEYLQVIYPFTALPGFFSSMLSGGRTFNGSPAYLIVSTAAFRNENY